MEEEIKYDAECPKCKQYTIVEHGYVFLQGNSVRVQYECKCHNPACDYEKDLDEFLSDGY